MRHEVAQNQRIEDPSEELTVRLGSHRSIAVGQPADAVRQVHQPIRSGYTDVVDAMKPIGEPDAANPQVRARGKASAFDERAMETEHGLDTEAPPTERGGNG